MATRYEYFTPTTDDIWQLNGSQRFEAQTFTPSVSHTINYVVLKLSEVGTAIGDFVVNIYATDVEGKPTGSSLASGLVSCDTITSVNNYTINLTSGASLIASTKYAIVCSCPDGGPITNHIVWHNLTAGGYSGGSRVSTVDGGTTWTIQTSDFYFEEWGDEIAVDIPVSEINLSAPLPTISLEIGDVVVNIPVTNIVLSSPTPTVYVPPEITINIPASTINLTVPLPVLSLVSQWINENKSTTITFSNSTKHDATATNSDKHDATFTNQDKT